MRRLILLSILFLFSCKNNVGTDPTDESTVLSHTITIDGIIDQNGGELTEPTTYATVTFPPNAVNKPTEIQLGIVHNLPYDESLQVDNTYLHIGPDSLILNESVLVSIPYEEDNIPSELAEQTLQIHFYDKYKHEWFTVGDRVNISKNEAYARIDHFSYYSVRGNIEPKPIELSKPEKITYNSIKIGWTKTEDADFHRYLLYKSSTPEITKASQLLATISDKNQNEFIVEDLEPDTDYYFKVYVYDRQEMQVQSNETHFKTEVLNPLIPVTLFAPTAVYPNSLNLDWSQSNIQNFHKYEIRWSKNPGITLSTPDWLYTPYLGDTQAYMNGLEEGETYYFRIFVYDDKFQSEGSNEISVTLPYWEDMPGIMPDPNLEFYIRDDLQYYSGDLTPQILSTLHKIDWAIEVGYLKGIEHCNNLEYLNIRGKVSDISYLDNLTKLQYINFTENNIENISPLQNLTDIQILNLNRNNVRDISALENLLKLDSLYLDGNGITNISALSNNSNIIRLRLNWNDISDISPLSNLININELSLYDNNIEDISSIANMTNLIDLLLGNNNISDLTVFENINFVQLKRLRLSDNNISDIGPLVRNQSISAGSTITIQDNLLNDESINTYIQELRSRGVIVWY